ncbi:hypothetical protein BGZ74_004489 [Mortierella antarctica]|nr:hypothetical protein BGZ74_004489 [Mortierella antarctica]
MNSKATPGYLFPEIMSHVLLKAVKILCQLAQSGSANFRRSLARQGKGLLAELARYRGSWDEVHGDILNNDVRTMTEDLIEYLHANPVQVHDDDDLEVPDSLTTREAAVLKNSTQDLQRFDFETWSEHSDGDNTSSQGHKKKPAKVSKREPDNCPAPPLPGFGNPAFQKDNQPGEPTVLTKLFDWIQDLTALPPSYAMRAAYREQEQRTQGMAAGGWSGGGARDGRGILPQDMVTNRAFSVHRPGTNSGGVQPRNETSAAVYALVENANESTRIQGGSGAEKEVYGVVSAANGQIRDVVLEGFKQKCQSSTGSLKYLYLIAGLLTMKETYDAIMQCPVVPTLLQTLTGPRRLSAPQKSIAVLSSDILGSFENRPDAVETIGFSDHFNLCCHRFIRQPPQHLGRADVEAAHVMRAQGAYYRIKFL